MNFLLLFVLTKLRFAVWAFIYFLLGLVVAVVVLAIIRARICGQPNVCPFIHFCMSINSVFSRYAFHYLVFIRNTPKHFCWLCFFSSIILSSRLPAFDLLFPLFPFFIAWRFISSLSSVFFFLSRFQAVDLHLAFARFTIDRSTASRKWQSRNSWNICIIEWRERLVETIGRTVLYETWIRRGRYLLSSFDFDANFRFGQSTHVWFQIHAI